MLQGNRRFALIALASLAETRDNDTGNHLKRTQEYIKCLALRLTANEYFATRLTDSYLSMIIKSAPLHDIGIAVASGKRTKSELSGVGEEEFAPWIIGPVM